MMKVIRNILGVLGAAALFFSCAFAFDPPAGADLPDNTGRVVLSVSARDGSARTVQPAETPEFSRYKVVFSREGESDITVNDAAGLEGAGLSRDLKAGKWTAAVTAYRTFTVTDGTPDKEYPAAEGSVDITVAAAQTTTATVRLAPLAVAGAETGGIFAYTVSFPQGASATLQFGSEEAVTLTSGRKVSAEKDPGYYDLYISVTKDSLSAGLWEKAHIYAGLVSELNYTFTEADFTAIAYLSGTLALPEGVSVTTGTVKVYADEGYEDPPLGQETVAAGSVAWTAGIPVSNSGSVLYLRAEATGSDGMLYWATGDTGEAVTEAGLRDIPLSGVAYKAATPVANPEAGAVDSGTTVALTTDTGGADIYYTLDGSAPDSTKTPYASPIEITADVTIKAIAVKAGWEDSDILEAPYIPFTKGLQFPEEPNGHFGVTQTDWQGEDAAQSWTLTAGEEPTVYFAVGKDADQSIAIGGTDAAKVKAVTTANLTLDDNDQKYKTPEGFTVPALNDTIAVYAVDTADLIFDGDFVSGTPSRSFTLTVTEDGHEGIVYTVSLQPSLDKATTATIYQRKDDRWLKIRNPTFSAANVTYSGADSTNSIGSGLKNIIYENAPVTDLETAFAWVTFNAKSGTGPAYKGGTITGHSEYRIFLKADQQIGPIRVVYPETTEYVSLELYGAGSPGKAEWIITRNTQWNSEGLYALNKTTADCMGLISVVGRMDSATIFILGKNVTLSGNNELTKSSAGLGQVGVRYLLSITGANVVLIMRDYAKITGYNATGTSFMPIYVTAFDSSQPSIFYMAGGEISGNTFNTAVGVASLHGYEYSKLAFFYQTGGVISENTQNRVIYSDKTVAEDITTPPPGWPGSSE